MLHPIMGPIPAKPLADVETNLSNLDHVIEALLVKFSFQFEYFFLQSGHPFDIPIVFGEFILQREILCVKDPAIFSVSFKNSKKSIWIRPPHLVYCHVVPDLCLG